MTRNSETLMVLLSDVQQKLEALNRDIRDEIIRLGAIRTGLRRLRVAIALFVLFTLVAVFLLTAGGAGAGRTTPVALNHAAESPVLRWCPLNGRAIQVQQGCDRTGARVPGDTLHCSAEPGISGFAIRRAPDRWRNRP